jgi:hypothetical protein
MPRTPIDYSKTIIYKIVCNDLTVKDVYVGGTTDFRKRKNKHKSSCDTKKTYKIYQIIRDNGGWVNWTMLEIEKFPCKDKNESRTRERYWYEQLKPTLNTILPITTKEETKEKIKEYAEKYREEHKEEIKQYHANNYIENKEEIDARNKAYKEKNQEKRKEYEKQYRKEHAEEIKKKNAEKYIQNKEKIKARNAKWRAENPEKEKERGIRRRAEKKAQKTQTS